MTEDDLVAAIHADPDSDAPRIAYAEWLQSRGDPLGEYIALSLQNERAFDANLDARLESLEYERIWQQRFGPIRRKTERGMIGWLGLDVRQLEPVLLDHLRGTFVRELRVNDSSTTRLDDRRFGVLREALARMHLRRVSFNLDLSPEWLAQLLACVPHVEELTFAETRFDDAAARVVADAPLPKLARLNIWGRWREPGPRGPGDPAVGDAGAIAIASGERRRGLVELSVTNAAIGAEGAAALASGPLPLTSLDLSGNPLGSAGVAAIARGTAPLESLTLGGVGLDDEAITALANSPGLARLRRLALAGNYHDSGVTLAQLDKLVASPFLSRDLVLGVDGIALEMEVFSSPGSYFSDPIDPEWVGPVPPSLAARFRVEVVGQPRE